MRASSVIMLTRGHGDGLEVFWSQRQHHMSFLGGFWAFAGGSVDADDTDVALSREILAGGPTHEYYGCAARELFEETGLWVGVDGLRHVSDDAELQELRERLEAGEFSAVAEALGKVDIDRLIPVGRWETPDWFETRFDSEFFAVALTADENSRFGAALEDHLLEAELLRGEWTNPQRALEDWTSAKRLMTLPIRQHLEALASNERVQDVEVHSADVSHHHTMWLAVPGIVMLPLRTPTLPPATHTNCYIVGEERFVVIDPGSPNTRDQELLDAVIAQMLDEGRDLLAVVLTHHHQDHVLGVEHLVQRFECEVWGHEKTAQRVDFPVDRHLTDGEMIDLGRDALRCVFTPGHAPGHLAFLHERTNSLLGGDLVASSGTILVNPPDGHMGDYLSSLELARDLDLAALYPAHGWTVTAPNVHLQRYIDHRLAREEKIYQALKEHPQATPMDVVPTAYADVPAHIWPIAARSAEAHLMHLVEIGRASLSPSGRFHALG